ncbi:MAG: alanine--tRNA ligase [Chlamydiota bacterium]
MLTQNIRRKFLDFYKNNGHTVVPSASVVPHDDPTLLFNNAGMNQFKDAFLGKSQRDYTRATTSQKCLRVGGKHNDLENVGHTKRHLTFFEMLGNFSFGDYFKQEAIKYSWQVCTEILGFDPERLWPTVYLDDDEAFDLWTQYVPAERITRFGEKENFWSMGDTGPCGPCSEILYDRGPAYGDAPNPTADVETGERYLEFWNLVFMQYNRAPSGEMLPLPNPSIDTGAGIERLVALKMDVNNVFETDVLHGLVQEVEKISGKNYNLSDKILAPAYHVIADHLRALSFAIADGAQPSNVDRGYVLRKILRRAVRYGRMLDLNEPFLAKILPELVTTMGPDYPELITCQNRIAEILTLEEEAFLRTLRRGGNILANIITDAKSHNNKISGDDAFKLKDTYGFPLEEVALIARDENLHVDTDRYQQLEKEARQRSRAAHKKTSQEMEDHNIFADYLQENGACQFVGYDHLTTSTTVAALYHDNQQVDRLPEGQEGIVILYATPFYPEKGGQVGDIGIIDHWHGSFAVTDCQEPLPGVIAHIGKVTQGTIKVCDEIKAEVEAPRRQKVMNNHTATHLLHWALCEVLGGHAQQAGSIVDPHRLRFDFSHHKALTAQEIKNIEDLVNEKIRTNQPVHWYQQSYDEAQKSSEIKQFFGDKYGSQVRVVDIEFSKELCGGTHTPNLGRIGYFRITKEGSIAAGIRRIEAVTGEDAEAFARQSDDTVNEIAQKLKSQPNKILTRIDKLLEDNKQLQDKLKTLHQAQIASNANNLATNVEYINDIPVVCSKVDCSSKDLRCLADKVSESLGTGIIVLGLASNERCQILIKVSDDLVSKGYNANQLIKEIAPTVEGSGGGKADTAQAGGKKPEHLEEALKKTYQLLQE